MRSNKSKKSGGKNKKRGKVTSEQTILFLFHFFLLLQIESRDLDEIERKKALKEMYPDLSNNSIGKKNTKLAFSIIRCLVGTLTLLDEDKINYELIEEVVWRVCAGLFDKFLPPNEEEEKTGRKQTAHMFFISFCRK